MYDKGDGVPQDDAEAVKWYGHAAEQGDASPPDAATPSHFSNAAPAPSRKPFWKACAPGPGFGLLVNNA